jgi:undecaprenyl phosphate-alpha-L-ara4FN deformylase
MDRTIGIKVDVDTFAGMRSGVPVLLDIFRENALKASFFVPMGKDNTGRTVKRVFTRKGFLKKTGRVGIVSTYGVKTLMYGLVLPGPRIAQRNIGLIRKIIDEGHELGIHGYDHVKWHDSIKHFDEERTRREIDKLLLVYREVVGEDTRSFAAPGWMINPFVLKIFDEKGLVYSSDTRGAFPFYPEMSAKKFTILQIPTTLPTLDEVIGIVSTDEKTLVDHYLGLLTDGLNIVTVHTELEGKRWSGFLRSFIDQARRRGYSFARLIDIAQASRNDPSTPTCPIEYGTIPSRAGEVCVQISG